MPLDSTITTMAKPDKSGLLDYLESLATSGHYDGLIELDETPERSRRHRIDAKIQEVDRYARRPAEGQGGLFDGDEDTPQGENCGTGAGGFQKGNKCQRQGQGPDKGGPPIQHETFGSTDQWTIGSHHYRIEENPDWDEEDDDNDRYILFADGDPAEFGSDRDALAGQARKWAEADRAIYAERERIAAANPRKEYPEQVAVEYRPDPEDLEDESPWHVIDFDGETLDVFESRADAEESAQERSDELVAEAQEERAQEAREELASAADDCDDPDAIREASQILSDCGGGLDRNLRERIDAHLVARYELATNCPNTQPPKRGFGTPNDCWKNRAVSEAKKKASIHQAAGNTAKAQAVQAKIRRAIAARDADRLTAKGRGRLAASERSGRRERFEADAERARQGRSLDQMPTTLEEPKPQPQPRTIKLKGKSPADRENQQRVVHALEAVERANQARQFGHDAEVVARFDEDARKAWLKAEVAMRQQGKTMGPRHAALSAPGPSLDPEPSSSPGPQIAEGQTRDDPQRASPPGEPYNINDPARPRHDWSGLNLTHQPEPKADPLQALLRGDPQKARAEVEASIQSGVDDQEAKRKLQANRGAGIKARLEGAGGPPSWKTVAQDPRKAFRTTNPGPHSREAPHPTLEGVPTAELQQARTFANQEYLKIPPRSRDTGSAGWNLRQWVNLLDAELEVRGTPGMTRQQRDEARATAEREHNQQWLERHKARLGQSFQSDQADIARRQQRGEPVYHGD